MFDFIRRFFDRQPQRGFFEEAVEDFHENQYQLQKLPKHFTIEHHVELDRYYPMYKNLYLKRERSGQLVTAPAYLFEYAICSTSEQRAKLLIDECIRQQTVRVIE